jgi:hypothetical protein
MRTGEFMGFTNEQVVWEEIQSLSERTLLEEVVLPLIGRLQFERVEVRHGPYERGVDILCLKKDELGEEDLLGIQVKRLKFTGKATDSGHLHGVLNQLSQCLEEPVILVSGAKKLLDRIWLVSPYELNIAALETSIAKYQGAVSRRLRIVDGLQLISLLRRYAPDVLAKYGDQRALYRQRLEREVAVLHEAAALRLREKPSSD